MIPSRPMLKTDCLTMQSAFPISAGTGWLKRWSTPLSGSSTAHAEHMLRLEHDVAVRNVRRPSSKLSARAMASYTTEPIADRWRDRHTQTTIRMDTFHVPAPLNETKRTPCTTHVLSLCFDRLRRIVNQVVGGFERQAHCRTRMTHELLASKEGVPPDTTPLEPRNAAWCHCCLR